MKYNTQNEKIEAITDNTMVVGIDIGSEEHFARAFDNRGRELSAKPFSFHNDEEGFASLITWMEELKQKHGMRHVMPGMEPTGHYWFDLAAFLQKNDMRPVHVNPYHVKQSKELDDNNPNKTDRKDPKVIAGLVNEGRYSYPYIPEGIYAEIRSLSNQLAWSQKVLTGLKNRLARWFSIYFPEYREVYKNLYAVSGMMILRKAPLPADIAALGVQGVNQIWRDAKMKAVGLKRAMTLVNAAINSIGKTEGPEAARIELKNLLEDIDRYMNRINELMTLLAEKASEVPYIDKLLRIRGVGPKTAYGFIAEVGDIRRFDDPKQLQKLAGFAIVESSSGKHQGKYHISYRGRKRLRYVLYEAALSVVGQNPEFKGIYQYYTTRKLNPLKKMQALVAIACKLIRVFYVILAKGVDYDGTKMLNDIRRPQEDMKAA